MTPLEGMNEVQKLRVSLARITQSLGFLPGDIPGNPPTWTYEHLCQAAQVERGWNTLAATLVERINERKMGGDMSLDFSFFLEPGGAKNG